MQVKVTVSRPGGKVGNNFSQSIFFKEIATIEELTEAINKEFGSLFPKYASLEVEPKKKSKAKE